MKILNHAQFNHHMDPKNNYLAGNGLGNESEPPEIINIEEENQTEVIEGEVLDTPEFGTSSLHNQERLRVGQRSANIPDFLKITVGQLANEPGVRQKDIAEAFDVKGPMVSKCKNGITNYGGEQNQALVAAVKDRKQEIKDEALDKVLHTLGLLSLDDISMLGAKDKTDVAYKLAKVADAVSEKQQVNTGNVQFVIMTPQVREKVHYETLDV